MKVERKIGIAAVMDFLLIITGFALSEVILWSLGFGIIVVGSLIGYALVKYNKAHLRIIKPLPDPLKKTDGGQIKNEEEWQIRRKQMKETLQSLEYGHIPPAPDKIYSNLIRTDVLEGEGKKHTLLLTAIPSEKTPDAFVNFTVWIYVPEKVTEVPIPALIKVSPEGTGTQEPIASYLLERGYAYACFNHIELDLDTYGKNVDGHCQLLYPKYDWGSLAVWAWGAMRVLDYLLKEPWVKDSKTLVSIDSEKTIVTGHSRR